VSARFPGLGLQQWGQQQRLHFPWHWRPCCRPEPRLWCALVRQSQVEHAEAVAHDNEALRAELDRVRAELEASLACSQREAAAAQQQLAQLRGQAAVLAADREV
jgi:hypothetical protein